MTRSRPAGRAADSSAGSSRPVSTKCPRWLVPNCSSKPSSVSLRLGRRHHAGVVDRAGRGCPTSPRRTSAPTHRGQVQLRDVDLRGVDLGRGSVRPPASARVEVAARQHHAGAVGGEFVRSVVADAGIRSGDDGDPPPRSGICAAVQLTLKNLRAAKCDPYRATGQTGRMARRGRTHPGLAKRNSRSGELPARGGVGLPRARTTPGLGRPLLAGRRACSPSWPTNSAWTRTPSRTPSRCTSGPRPAATRPTRSSRRPRSHYDPKTGELTTGAGVRVRHGPRCR